ncbi:hypothetical protein D3C71_1654170 [compost metagenome]
MRAQRRREFDDFFRRIVHDQHAIHARAFGVGGEFGLAHAFDGIGVAHQHHRCLGIALTEFGHQFQHAGQAHTLGNGAIGRALNHGAIGHGVRERHPQFEDVGTGLDQRVHQGHRGRGRRVASRDVGNQRRGTAGFGGASEGRSDTINASCHVVRARYRHVRRRYACLCRRGPTN